MSTLPLSSKEIERLRQRLESMSDAELLQISPLTDQAALQVQQQAERPQTPMDLARACWGEKWASPPHLRLLNLKLSQVATGGIKRLLITMPPRHGKSELTSAHFPAWYLGTYPDHRIILSSYEADFAASWGRRARSILEEHGLRLFDLQVSKASSAADRWDIAGRRGGMNTAGVGGAITGKGAHLLLIDDPVKNSEEANSYVIRQKTWEWYQSTAYTRLEPDGAVIVIQTRWHGDDLAGRLLKEAKRHEDVYQWEILDLPAVARDGDALGRTPGAALWPERYNEKDLQVIRKSVGEYVWSALYQQRPQSDEGGKIKREWLRHWEPHGDFTRLLNLDGSVHRLLEPKHFERFAFIDAAGSSDDVTREKKGKPHSFSVITTIDWCRSHGVLVIRDIRRGRWDFPGLCQQVKEAYNAWNPQWIGVEDASNGRPLWQTMRALPLKALSHEGKDKLMRAGRALNDFEQGNIFIKQDAIWRDELESELLAWTGEKDEQADQIDTLAYACNHVPRSGGGKTVTMRGVMVGGV